MNSVITGKMEDVKKSSILCEVSDMDDIDKMIKFLDKAIDMKVNYVISIRELAKQYGIAEDQVKIFLEENHNMDLINALAYECDFSFPEA